MVDNKETYHFSVLLDHENLKPLAKRNAVGWHEGSKPGNAIINSIRGYLGLFLFKSDRKLFISYKRSDGSKVANQVYNYLKMKGFQVFLDTKDIDAGRKVQPNIENNISEKDFILLIDSEDVKDSEWVHKEILMALEKKIPIQSLFVPKNQLNKFKLINHLITSIAKIFSKRFYTLYETKDQHEMTESRFPELRMLPCMKWKDNKNIYSKLENFISQGIGAKVLFDDRVKRSIISFADIHKLDIHNNANRQIILSKEIDGKEQTFFLEFEYTSIDLLKLYHFSIRFEASCTTSHHKGYYIISDIPIINSGKKAIEWALRDKPLFVISLEDLQDVFISVSQRRKNNANI